MSKIKITLLKENETMYNFVIFQSNDVAVLDFMRKHFDTNGEVWDVPSTPSWMKQRLNDNTFFEEYTHFFFRTLHDNEKANTVTLNESESLLKFMETKDQVHITNLVNHKVRYVNLIVDLFKSNFFDIHELEFVTKE